MRLPLTFVCVLALCLSAPPTTEAKSRKKTKTKSAAAKKAHIEQAAPSQKDVAESSEHIQRMKDARANKDAEKYEQMEAACKANPRDVDLARKASYMYYHAARPAQAVKHFDRVRMHSASTCAVETPPHHRRANAAEHVGGLQEKPAHKEAGAH